MPNGRSGGFLVQRDQLRQTLEALPGDVTVGTMRDAARRPAGVTSAQLVSLLDMPGPPLVAVEEQDHVFYVIHVQRDPEWVWVMVPGSSRLLPELRQLHEAWRKEHPDDKSWMAF